MTIRLIALMSVVLFASLAAFGFLLGASQEAIMKELQATVSTVGAKTLSAFVARPDRNGPDASQTPTETGTKAETPGPPGEMHLRKSFRFVTRVEGSEAAAGVERRARLVQEEIAALATEGGDAAANREANEVFVVFGTRDAAGGMWHPLGNGPVPAGTDCQKHVEEWVAALSTDAPPDGAPEAGTLLVVADWVQTEADQGEVKARIPMIRVRPSSAATHSAVPPPGGDESDRDALGGHVDLFLPPVVPPADGEPYQISVREDVVFNVPTTNYQAIFDKIRKRTLFLFLGVFAFGTILSAGLARRFLRPLHQLDAGFKRLSSGDVDVKVVAKGNDEMGRLGLAFNAMTRRLRAARERAREMVRKEKLSALGRLAAGVAHDVRNPLQSINLTLQHLIDTARPEGAPQQVEFDRSVGLIREEVRRLDRLVGTFLRFARSERGLRQPVVLAEVLKETAQLVMKEAERRRVTIDVEAAPAPPIDASEESLKSSLLNLVLNSFEAMPNGGRVVLRAGMDGDRPFVEVEDTGVGIPEDDQDRVFDFGFTTRENGHGLGLAMVHQVVVEEHGGRVHLHTRAGEGTRFRLEFPAAPKEPT